MGERIRGMKDMRALVDQANLWIDEEGLSPKEAAGAMKKFIQGAIRAYIEAAEATEIDRAIKEKPPAEAEGSGGGGEV